MNTIAIGSRRIEDHDEHHSGDLEKNNIEKKWKTLQQILYEKQKIIMSIMLKTLDYGGKVENYEKHHGEYFKGT